MANHKSAEKRNRQNKKQRVRNASLRSKLHGSVRKLRAAIDEKSQDEAKELLPKTESQIMRARTKGILHRNTAARKVARLARAVHKLGK